MNSYKQRSPHLWLLWPIILGLVCSLAMKKSTRSMTPEDYVQVVEKGNVTLVFFKEGCPYCQAGRKAVKKESQESPFPVIWVDVETDAGQALAAKYGVHHAASLVRIRNHQVEGPLTYASKVHGQIVANQEVIDYVFRK